MLMPLLDTKPSHSLPILMLPDLPRTLLTPLPFPLQSSLLPQHLMLPSPLHPSQLALLPLTPLSSRESLLPSELTPESPPQYTNIVPQINVQKYNVDVPVAIPRAVPREIVQVSHVAKPYEVAVPRAVPVPAPYKVRPVQEIVETPHIHHATVETHSAHAVVTAHAAPVHAVSHVPVGIAHA